MTAVNVAIRKIGNSEGVILPKEELRRLGVGAGDQLILIRTPDGLRLVKADADLEQQIKAARKGMRRYRATLAKLAK